MTTKALHGRLLAVVEPVTALLGVPARTACRVLGQHCSTQRKARRTADTRAALSQAVVGSGHAVWPAWLSAGHGPAVGRSWHTNHKRVERTWRAKGLRVPARQPKRSRLWLNSGSCVRLRPERPNHVWAHDLVENRTRGGRRFCMLHVVGEVTQQCLAIRVGRRLGCADVSTGWRTCSSPGHTRVRPLRQRRRVHGHGLKGWVAGVRASTAHSEPGSLWENGTGERFNGKPRDERLRAEVFNALAAAKVLIEQWQAHNNTVQPHSALDPRLPATGRRPGRWCRQCQPCRQAPQGQ